MAKYRLSFVTNSSSSSFVISKRDITLDQYELAKQVGWENDWNVYESGKGVVFETFMDNYDMHSYLESIGVNVYGRDNYNGWGDNDEG